MISHASYELHGARVLEVGAADPVIQTVQDATQLIGEALQSQADWVYLPSGQLSPAFFDLKNGLAGEVVQKFANYSLCLAIVGDLPGPAIAARSLGDFVREANRSRNLWFIRDRGEFSEKLKRQRGTLA